MKFLPLIIFGILMVRDAKRFVESLVETNIVSYKDIFWLMTMVIGMGLSLFYCLD